MDSSVLYPPNRQLLSENVIGVRPRAKTHNSVIMNEGRLIQEQNLLSSYTISRQSPESETKAKSSRLKTKTSPADQAKTFPSTSENTSLRELRRLQTQDSAIREFLLLDQRIQRERRRIYQKRYRKKQDDRATNLQEETRKLQQEIKRLEQRQSDQHSNIPLKNSVWSVTAMYFETFRYGDGTSSRAQLNFIRTKVSPNVVFNGGCGTEALLESWKCLSLALQNFEMEVEGLKKENSNSVVATTRTSFTLTERTVRHIFPHLLNTSSEYENATLLQQLVGKDIVVFGRTRFEFNDLEGKVSSIMTQSDFLTPVLGLVGSLENASRVFDKSRISPEFVWKEDNSSRP